MENPSFFNATCRRSGHYPNAHGYYGKNTLAIRLRRGGETERGGKMKVVFDTSVLVAAARSRLGASYALLSSIPSPEFQLCLSVGLYTEWLEVLTRGKHLPPGQTAEDARRFLAYLASQAHLQEIHFLWRPFLADPDDDMVLELAVAANCRYIITHNVKDFRGSEQFGITAWIPREFLNLIRKKP